MKTIRLFALALALVGPMATVSVAHSQAIRQVSFAHSPAIRQVALDEDLATGFAQLTVGMSGHDVLAAMKKEPTRKESTNHLGLEIVRLVWTQWGSTFQVVLVAGRLVSKASEKKSLIG